MSTISIADKKKYEADLCQGDIFKNVKYSYIDSESETELSVVEYTFPLAIIVSQACDVIGMEKTLKNHEVNPTKFMPAILMCPIYDSADISSGIHIKKVYGEDVSPDIFVRGALYRKEDSKVADIDWHYRYHVLNVEVDDKRVMEKLIIDFKHYFTVPMSYLFRHKKDDRLYCLRDIFAEQVTLKFTVFLSRVAIPAPEQNGKKGQNKSRVD